jgi:hypothetical protein
MADQAKTKIEEFLMPVGRMINASLFEKDAYKSERGKESVPAYRIEVAYDSKDLNDFYEKLDEIAGKMGWGKLDVDGGDVATLKEGDKLKKKREAKGKQGDAYAGKEVMRAKTIYNKDGADSGGGIQVWDEDVKPIGPANRGAIYNGCMVQVAVGINPYVDDEGDPCFSFYLKAVQKVGDGERLAQAADTSVLFKPVGRAAGGESEGRRSRRG